MTLTLVSHRRERALALAALAGVVDTAWPLRELSRVDWPWMLDRLRANALGARFWAQTQRTEVAEAMPARIRELLERDAHETAARNALLVHVALEAIAALDTAGVTAMPMKGVALCAALPSYGAVRPMHDVDLLVRAEDLARAAHALRGVFPSETLVRDYDGLEREADEALRDEVENLYTFQSGDGTIVELHHAWPGVHSRTAVVTAFDRALPIVHRGRRVLVPSVDDLLGSACVHVLVHHGAADAAMLLRHVADVRALLDGGASPANARALYDVGGGDTVARSQRLLADAREEARHPGARRCPASIAFDPGVHGRIRTRARNLGARIARVWGGVRRQGLRAVLPSRAFMTGIYGKDAAGAKLPLFHLRRWGGILVRTLRGRR